MNNKNYCFIKRYLYWEIKNKNDNDNKCKIKLEIN